ncbi:MAG TPA: hypothetical protein VG711_04505 [Phycisphaerales bacterium]|nr:hypothetical protein [Phycisphaerales bacterium]
MNKAMSWVKANVFSVIFLALMVIAPVGMFFVSNSLNANVKKQVDDRYKKLAPLEQLEKTPVTQPGDSTDAGTPAAVNQALLDDYQAASQELQKNAKGVYATALSFNRKDRGVIMDGVFPAPPEEELQTVPKQFHDALVEKYQDLLKRVHAGSPPPLESLRDILTKEKDLYISQTLQKALSDKLTKDDEDKLKEDLQIVRLKSYVEAANACGLYLAIDALHVPEWVQSTLPTPSDLFAWQWQYWATEDVLSAIATVNDMNSAEMNEVTAPVKRVLDLTVLDIPKGVATAGTSSSGSGGGGGGGAGRMSSAGGGSGASFSRNAPPTAKSGNNTGGAAKASGGVDYGVSFTGRTSNALYDVVKVSLRMVVETSKLPGVLDALAHQNFITVTDLNMTPRDAYADIVDGYFYGANPVSDVTLTLETVWLRDWTKEFMPEATKDALGIAKPPAAGAESTTPAAGAPQHPGAGGAGRPPARRN